MLRSKLNPSAPEFRPQNQQKSGSKNDQIIGSKFADIYSASYNINKKTTFHIAANATLNKEILQIHIIDANNGEVIHDECFSRSKIDIHFSRDKPFKMKIRGKCILYGGQCKIEKIDVKLL